jgi:WD40 repeat protein
MPPETSRHLKEPQLAVDISPDGRRIVCSGQNRAIEQIGLDGTEYPPLKNAPGGWCVAFSQDGKLIAGCGLDRIIRLWDSSTGNEVRQLQGHVQIAWMAAFLPGGQRLVSVGEDSTIRIWNLADGTEVGQMMGHPGPVWCMAVSPDGQWLATGGADGAMRVWDVKTRKLCRALDGKHGGGVGALCFSPDGRTLGSTGWQDQKLYLWEVSTGHCRRQVPHDGGSKYLLFTRDGRRLITAGNDKMIRFWDLAENAQLRPLAGHSGAINGLALGPGGRKLVSVSNDQTVRVWSLQNDFSPPKPRVMPERQLESCWAALARPEGRGAYDAIVSLGASPEQTLALFRSRLRPCTSPNRERIAALIADTGDPRYTTRERASASLEQLGEEAVAPLRQALRGDLCLESRHRIEQILQKLTVGGLSTETLRGVRSVEVLERIGTPGARAMLQELSNGQPAARITMEAQASLERLGKDGLTLR